MYYSNTKHIISCQATYPEACNTVAFHTLKSVKLLIFALPLGMDQWVHYARYTNYFPSWTSFQGIYKGKKTRQILGSTQANS